MEIKKVYIQNNNAYKLNRHIIPEWIVLHSTGDAVPQALNHVLYYNTPTVSESVHAFIDAQDGVVWQTLSWDIRAGHAGELNRNSIGIEMCETNHITYKQGATFTVKNKREAIEQTQRTFDTAVELCAMLCELYNLPAAKVIGHGESRQLGLTTTTHVDPEHLWKGLGMGYDMAYFRGEVNKHMMSETRYQTLAEVPVVYRDAIARLVDMGWLSGNHLGLNLTNDMCRMFTVNYRAGLYGGMFGVKE